MRKIKNYRDFLKLFLLESIVYQTGDFRNFLRYLIDKDVPISTKASEISKSLENLDVKTNINYIGISTRSNDELSFIPDTQFQRYMSQNNQSISLKTKSFTSVGRAFRQLLVSFGISFTNQDIEQFANEYKSWWDLNYSDKKFEIVKGPEILKWYLEKNYTKEQSTLGNSCMKYESRNHFMNLYADNTETVSMCIVKEGDKISARAILWTLENGDMLLDRIYYTEDNLQSFVQDNTTKTFNKKIYSYYSSNLEKKMVTNLKNVNYEKFPYADTMIYVYQKLVDGKIEGSGKISNSNELEIEGDFKLIQIQSTSGTPEDLSHVFSKKREIWIKRSDAVWSDNSSDWLPKSDFNYSKYLDIYIEKDYSIYSDNIQDFIPKEEAINHPKFGLVPKSRVFDTFEGYDGYIEPISFYTKLKNMEFEKFKIKEELILNDSEIFKFGGINFKQKDLIYLDYIDEYYPKLACEEAVSLSRSDFDELKEKGLDFLILDSSYILKIDAEILKLSYTKETLFHSYHQVSKMIKKFGKKVYLNWIQTIEDDQLKQKRLSKFESYDIFLQGDSEWVVGSIIGRKDAIGIFIKTFLTAFEHGDSEKLFYYNDYENLNLNQLIDKSLNNFYGRDLSSLDEEIKKLMVKYYKMMMTLYYITSDSFDSKRFLYYNNPSISEKRTMGNPFGSSDDRLEALRESIKRTYNPIFDLLELSFDIIKENDDSLEYIKSFSVIKSYLKPIFYSEPDLFKVIFDIQ